MTFFYNLAFIIFALLYCPIFLVKSSQAENRWQMIKERLGMLPKQWKSKYQSKKVLWVHAVSVGETMVVRNFLFELLRNMPDLHIVLTTVTPTGQKIAKQMKHERLETAFFPFDIRGCVRSFFKRLNPIGLLLVETEVWPNLLTEANSCAVPVGIINGRLSPQSESRYRSFSFVFRPFFSRLSFVLAQTRDDALRFESAGVRPERLYVMGNMKFDIAESDQQDLSAESMKALRESLGIQSSDRVMVAGSTHPGEEELLLATLIEARKDFPQLKLIVAPRHVERTNKIAALIKKRGLSYSLFSDKAPVADVLIVDQIGILRKIYGVADVVVLGGSFIPHGGQNPIEPACFKKAVLHGPHVFNFKEMYRILDHAKGAMGVPNPEDLCVAVKDLLGNVAKRQEWGERAYEVVMQMQGATREHVQWVQQFLTNKSDERNHHVEEHKKLFSSVSGGA